MLSLVAIVKAKMSHNVGFANERGESGHVGILSGPDCQGGVEGGMAVLVFKKIAVGAPLASARLVNLEDGARRHPYEALGLALAFGMDSEVVGGGIFRQSIVSSQEPGLLLSDLVALEHLAKVRGT